MKLAFATTMIRPRYLSDSIVAQLVSVAAFLHSLDPSRTFRVQLANRHKPISRDSRTGTYTRILDRKGDYWLTEAIRKIQSISPRKVTVTGFQSLL